MLVLSRRLNEKIVLPAIQTNIQVLSVKSGAVRLGIDAPPEITVLREELQGRFADRIAEQATPRADAATAKSDELVHQIRDRLKESSMGLGLVHLLLEAGAIEDAKAVLARLRHDLQVLRFGVDGE